MHNLDSEAKGFSNRERYEANPENSTAEKVFNKPIYLRGFAAWAGAGQSLGFVRDDVHIYFRRFAQKAVRGGKIEILSPAFFHGTAEDDLGDVFFPDRSGHSIRHANAL